MSGYCSRTDRVCSPDLAGIINRSILRINGCISVQSSFCLPCGGWTGLLIFSLTDQIPDGLN